MKANSNDVLAAQLYFHSAFPVLRLPLEETAQAKKFAKKNMVVEFRAADDENPLACYLVFLTEEMAAKTEKGKRFKVYQGEYPGYITLADGTQYSPKLTKMYFSSIKSLLGVFKGSSPLEMLGIMPVIFKNIANGNFWAFLFLMLTLTKTMPTFTPGADQPDEQYLKVKMSLYLITSALSQATKLGWQPMVDWCAKQSDRIYQFKVGATFDKDGKEIYPAIAAYFRVKAGHTKAGRGEYTRRRPFVLLDFPNPDSCLAVLTGKYEFVDAVNHKCVTIVGSGDSYAVQFNNLMSLCQGLLLPAPKVAKE